MVISYPNPLPFKLRILHGLTASLKQITPGNGFVYDLSDNAQVGTRVFRGRAWFGEGDPIPMLSILEGVAPGDFVAEPPVDTSTSEYTWPLIVQGFVNDDPENPTDPAHLLQADVRKRLAYEKTRKIVGDVSTRDIFGLGLGRFLVDLTIGSGVVRPADDISSKAYFWLSLGLRIVDKAANPYA